MLFDTVISSAILSVHERYESNDRRFDVQLTQQPIKLGRSAQGGPHGPNDLALEVPFAARDQARIEPEGLGHRVVHLGAPNRLSVQDKPIDDRPYTLRLSADSDAAERGQRVERALQDVEMLAHRAKQVDALSGGQRKRVSIAAKLLADPSLFFLDEPTSGLDPGLEKKMMHTLRQLADGGCRRRRSSACTSATRA